MKIRIIFVRIFIIRPTYFAKRSSTTVLRVCFPSLIFGSP